MELFDQLTVQQWVGLGVGGLGALFLLVALWWLVARMMFVSRARTATGQVIGLVQRTRRNTQTHTTSVTYAPSVRFTTAAGQEVEFVSALSSNRPRPVGSAIEVLYLEHAPHKAKARGGLFLGPFVFLFVGAVLGGVGAFVAFMR